MCRLVRAGIIDACPLIDHLAGHAASDERM
jgi:hypothetical protein